MERNSADAPGAPGLPPRWTSSAKSGVGTAHTPSSRVWFTISHGILNEIYYPRIDIACTRDLGLIVTDGKDYFSEEKRDTVHEIRMVEDGVPAFRLVNTARDGRYRIHKTVLSDPQRDVVLQEISFEALEGESSDYRLYVLLAPHVLNVGSDNTAWVGDHKGWPMLFASGKRGVTLALASSVPWIARSAGYVGSSDGWQQLSRYKVLNAPHERAERGNVALTGEIDLRSGDGRFVLALGFGGRPEAAGHHALAALHEDFEATKRQYVKGWRDWQEELLPLDRADANKGSIYRVSTAVLASHHAVQFPGAIIASLSIPWGYSKGDEDLGGYHLVWPRDLVETAGGFLAAGAIEKAMSVLGYLQAVQEADGRLPQNMWLDGAPYWGGVQMDECAFSILLVDLMRRTGHLSGSHLDRYVPMVERAAGFVVRNGPLTDQDRWEENAGYSPFTLAVEIAGLLAAAEILELAGRGDAARYLRETADTWNDEIESWTFVTGTEPCERFGVEGYYVRIAPPASDGTNILKGMIQERNRPLGEGSESASLLVSPDALALVRFGLRAPDDPRILDTVRVIDGLLRVDLPHGPVWRRYNGDGYGEHDDGRPFDGTGVGRPWPLLTGERAHYELAARRPEVASSLLATIEASAGVGGLVPEQVWDGPDMPERNLFRGAPAGSAMPLVWAHAEHIKLLRSLHDGRVFDMPPQPVQRYQKERVTSPLRSWRFADRRPQIPAGKTLRIEVLASATVHWTVDDWKTVHDDATTENAFGVHVFDLPSSALAEGASIRFTFFWHGANRWEGRDFEVIVSAAGNGPALSGTATRARRRKKEASD